MAFHRNIFTELYHGLPREDFLTSCFAFLLRLDNQLCRYLLREIFRRKRGGSQTVVETESFPLKVTTQQEYYIKGRAREVDLVMSFGQSLRVLMESKLGAPADRHQMRDYLQIAEDLERDGSTKRCYVLLLTRHDASEQFRNWNRRFVYCLWREISDILSTYAQGDLSGEKRYYIKAFLHFMEENGVTSFSGFRSPDRYGSAWNDYAEFRRNGMSILEDLRERMIKKRWQPWPKNKLEERWESNESYLSLSFRRENWKKWRAWWSASFKLDNSSKVVFVFSLGLRQNFRTILRQKSLQATRDATKVLRKDGYDVEWDRDEVAIRPVQLAGLLRGATNRDSQKTKMYSFIDENLRLLEKSRIIQLIEKF